MLQDAWADVQLLLLLNTGLVITGGLIKRFLVDRSSTVGPAEDFWNDIFDVSPASLATCLPLACQVDVAFPLWEARTSAPASFLKMGAWLMPLAVICRYRLTHM